MAKKRERFVAQLKQLAKDKGLTFRQEVWRGKGGHAMIWVGDRVTTLPSREIDPKTAKKILKTLGLDDPWHALTRSHVRRSHENDVCVFCSI